MLSSVLLIYDAGHFVQIPAFFLDFKYLHVKYSEETVPTGLMCEITCDYTPRTTGNKAWKFFTVKMITCIQIPREKRRDLMTVLRLNLLIFTPSSE